MSPVLENFSPEEITDRPMPELAGVRHHWRQVGDLRFHVAEAGEGPPLVLLHGWPEHWFVWRKLIGPLSARYRVICPDTRGWGWTDVPKRPYDRETMTRDMLALLDDMGVERFRLAGHDWGGWLAFLIALWHPKRVEALMPLNIAIPFSGITPAQVANQWRFWYQWVLASPVLGQQAVKRFAEKGDTVIGRWCGMGPRAWNEEESRIFLDQLKEPARRRASVELYRVFVFKDMTWMVAGRYRSMRLRTPTYQLHGVGDHIIRPVHLSRYGSRSDDMRHELVDCGHFIVDERPELVLDRMLSFFADRSVTQREQTTAGSEDRGGIRTNTV
jgi:pimeloyl-ACP methyl ester carboxylesterase